ncbi:MAG: hypothetical protein ATN33_03265 [Epulopiscium sp. Nele67-Bin001]|nr:MAG: hypothetical protein ATN33_03265 [Epulopiscium sp. Nele67-Bin001]
MKIMMCGSKEGLARDLDLEINIIKEKLGEDTEIVIFEYSGTEKEELKKEIATVDGVLISLVDLDSDIIREMKQCKVISVQATGYNYVDLDVCKENKIGLTAIDEYCTQEVADHCMAMLLSVARKIKFYNNDIEVNKNYAYNSTSGLIRLEGATLAIMGFGKIGKAVAKRAQGFGLNVIVYSPSCTQDVAKAHGCTLVTPDEIYAQADFIALTMRLTAQNENIINAESIAKMKKCPVIVNVARGALIDDDALIDGLDKGVIFGAGLDVLKEETAEYASKFINRDDILLTPHTAFYSDASQYEAQRISVDNLIYMLTGEYEKVCKIILDVQKR